MTQSGVQDMRKLKLLHQHRGENHHNSAIVKRSEVQDMLTPESEPLAPLEPLSTLPAPGACHRNSSYSSTPAALFMGAMHLHDTNILENNTSVPLSRRCASHVIVGSIVVQQHAAF
jgi:hypothetical protein